MFYHTDILRADCFKCGKHFALSLADAPCEAVIVAKKKIAWAAKNCEHFRVKVKCECKKNG